jgi:CCR4-NOT transcriptional regulation complex NOT5 subunit
MESIGSTLNLFVVDGRKKMDDLISRQAAIDRINKQREHLQPDVYPQDKIGDAAYRICSEFIERLPSAQPTLYGYNIEHLELIARVLQEEDLPPERIVEVLTDIGRIVAIVKDEFEETLRETLRKAVEQCTI